jgi:hypothetical protein
MNLIKREGHKSEPLRDKFTIRILRVAVVAQFAIIVYLLNR